MVIINAFKTKAILKYATELNFRFLPPIFSKVASVPGSLNENANSGILVRLKTLITIYADLGDFYAFLAKLKLKDILAPVTTVNKNLLNY